mgnify:CR=1 FL=1
MYGFEKIFYSNDEPFGTLDGHAKDCMKRLKNISLMFLLQMICVNSSQDISERVVMLNAKISEFVIIRKKIRNLHRECLT